MGLLLDAAQAWYDLCCTSYIIELGRKGHQFTLVLSFDLADFPHLAGMQYATDVDFGLRPAQYYGKKLVPAVMNGTLDETRLCKSRAWSRLEGRLKAIINLQKTLEGNFTIAQFHPQRVRGSCNINAEFVIKNTVSGDAFFVFLDQNSGRYYCKSAFQSNRLDYTENQPLMTVLEVTKRIESESEVLYRHANYKERAHEFEHMQLS